MPQFSSKAIPRIRAAVIKSERADLTGRGPMPVSDPDLRWMKLTMDFGTDTEDMAQGNFGKWEPSENDGDGAYSADVFSVYDIRDPFGNCGAATGDWVLCRPIRSDNDVLWEVVAVPRGGAVLWGKLDTALAYNGTATVSVWEDDWSAVTTDSIEGVKAPPTMTSGSIDAESWVRIRQRPDGVWYVDMAPC